MPVVTRSQAKSFPKTEVNTEVSTPKVSSKPNVVKQVPMYIWFGDMLRTYMADLNRVPDYEGKANDKIRIITEMFYMINEHYENVSSHKYYSKLTKQIYIKAQELRIEIISKYLNVPNANLALDELSETIKIMCKLLYENGELYENEELYENGEDENEVDKSSNEEDEDYDPNNEEDELQVQQDLEDDADQDYEEEYEEEEEDYIVKKPMNTHIRFEE